MWAGVIVCHQKGMSCGCRVLLPHPYRRQWEAWRVYSLFGLTQQHPSPALPCLRRGGSKARRWLLALARARIPRGAELGVGAPVRPALRVRQLAAHRVEQLQVACHAGEGPARLPLVGGLVVRSEEHTSELQSLMRISYAVFCLKKKKR